MMLQTSLTVLSDAALLSRLDRAVRQEQQATAVIIGLLMEVDTRKLWAQQGCSSLFTYCVQILHFSEHAAYLRIEAARAAKRFPVLLERLECGALHLTAISLLAPHLTPANHLHVLAAAEHKTKRDVEQLIAALSPKPDAPMMIRKLPPPRMEARAQSSAPVLGPPGPPPLSAHDVPADSPVVENLSASPRRPSVAITPLAPERFKMQFTVERTTYEKLRQAQDLLRHSLPDGNPAAIFDRALTLLLEHLSKTKCAHTERPRTPVVTRHGSRHIPAEVRRTVWRRDGGRCAFCGDRGRCAETGFLEFHHVIPYARGGAATVENIELRCRAHNAYESEQQFGPMLAFGRSGDVA